jgi:hypothetical protein
VVNIGFVGGSFVFNSIPLDDLFPDEEDSDVATKNAP